MFLGTADNEPVSTRKARRSDSGSPRYSLAMLRPPLQVAKSCRSSGSLQKLMRSGTALSSRPSLCPQPAFHAQQVPRGALVIPSSFCFLSWYDVMTLPFSIQAVDNPTPSLYSTRQSLLLQPRPPPLISNSPFSLRLIQAGPSFQGPIARCRDGLIHFRTPDSLRNPRAVSSSSSRYHGRKRAGTLPAHLFLFW